KERAASFGRTQHLAARFVGRRHRRWQPDGRLSVRKENRVWTGSAGRCGPGSGLCGTRTTWNRVCVLCDKARGARALRPIFCRSHQRAAATPARSCPKRDATGSRKPAVVRGRIFGGGGVLRFGEPAAIVHRTGLSGRSAVQRACAFLSEDQPTGLLLPLGAVG